MRRCLTGFGFLVLLTILVPMAHAASRVPIQVERPSEGAPLCFGLPFPKGAVVSPDHVRVLNVSGREIPAQVTEVTTWEPADPSLKWVWVFFFAEAGDRYFVEYGSDVRRKLPANAFEVVNNQRAKGLVELTTGPLRFVVRQGEGGFLHSIQLDLEGNGFDETDLIAQGPQARGSFLDLLDGAGLDPSKAIVKQTFIERGSGPLHTILRVEGEYQYGREDNQPAPFVTRIHAYAGKPYLRVLHSFVYTGEPDRHRAQEGEHAHIATQAEPIIEPDESDAGWTEPEDRIAAAGLALELKLDAPQRSLSALSEGTWWNPGASRITTHPIEATQALSLLQSGPRPTRMPPLPNSSPSERLEGFLARISSAERVVEQAERAGGWWDVSDARRGVAMGIRHFLEEYPKELRFDPAASRAEALLWSPRAEPMSFARMSSKRGREGAIENWAQGLAKTSELVFYFHAAGVAADEIARTVDYVLDPPVAHAEPAWYGATGVYGRFAARGSEHPRLERALDHQFEWALFNQRWEPWYGMFDHGDLKVRFDNGEWREWGHNEPAQDFELWVQFMRTGDARLFDAAQALSRHTMDVDNTHWPADPDYRGDSNYPLENWQRLKQPSGSKWRGLGRRHAPQHWSHVLTAHVWVQGWLADYYLAADHRALEVAVQTADMHLRRLWGDHGLTGRRLYLSVWNLTDVWDATKDERYAEELRERVGRMLHLQRKQGGTLVMDRYGYAHPYATHGLKRYLDMTEDPKVRRALVRHARHCRDVLPLNHWMESYLGSVHPLVLGYELTGEQSFLDELKRRVDPLETDALERPIDDSWTQQELAEALEDADHLPPDPGRFRPDMRPRPGQRSNWSPVHGLRFFGWTHGYGLPWALELLEE